MSDIIILNWKHLPVFCLLALSSFPCFAQSIAADAAYPEMVAIPAGQFLRQQRGSKVEVSIAAFEISKFETTFRQYDLFAEDTGRELPGDSGWGRDSRPAIHVSWHDATAYAAWLSEKTNETYRLPTQDEWEYAARAGTTSDYPWGGFGTRGNANCLHCNPGRQSDRTTPVGSFPANAFGLYDMNGNVWEWCQDWQSDLQMYRVIRGGAWSDEEDWIKSSAQHRWEPDANRYNVGFRLAKSIVPVS